MIEKRGFGLRIGYDRIDADATQCSAVSVFGERGLKGTEF